MKGSEAKWPRPPYGVKYGWTTTSLRMHWNWWQRRHPEPPPQGEDLRPNQFRDVLILPILQAATWRARKDVWSAATATATACRSTACRSARSARRTRSPSSSSACSTARPTGAPEHHPGGPPPLARVVREAGPVRIGTARHAARAHSVAGGAPIASGWSPRQASAATSWLVIFILSASHVDV